MTQRLWPLFLHFSWLLLAQRGQGEQYDEFDRWCSGPSTSSVMVDGKIYYDYGFTWIRLESGVSNYSYVTYANNPYLWALDLFSEFNVSKISKLSSIPQLTGYKKSIDIPWASKGIMWAARNGTIYETGGYILDTRNNGFPGLPAQTPMSRRRAVWSFDPTTREWGFVRTKGDEINRVSHAAYASAPDLGLHFAIGGVTSIQHQSENINYPPFLRGTVNNGMTIFNSDSLSLRNRTLEDLAWETATMPARKDGWCKHIPVGSKGMLVCHARFTGPPNGQVISDIQDTSPASSAVLNWTNYQTVDLYDIQNDKWHYQFTSSESTFPTNTLSGCAALGSDGRTWEIYMHGGSARKEYTDATEHANKQDIWVLTIPAFHWFRIPTDHNRRPLTGHECHIVGKQLITVSGVEIVEAGATPSWEEQYCTSSPFRVYDLEQLKWTDYFTPSKYAPPKVVADFVKVHSQPRFGWSSPEVEALVKGLPFPSPEPGRQPPNPLSKKDYRGAIAGGTMGSVVAIIAAVVLFIHFKRRGTLEDAGVGSGDSGLPIGDCPVSNSAEKYQHAMPG